MKRKSRPRIRELSRKGIYIIPNLFTSGNLFCGVFAIIAVLDEKYMTAAVSILVAMIFDTLDGKLARLTKTTSRFGVEYDSLSDLVSFGVAPGLLAYAWTLRGFGRLGWVALFLFVVCGALRLARFNVQISGPESKDFIGLPTPAAAGLIATMVIFDANVISFGDEVRPLITLFTAYLLAFLMVSHFRYRSFKDLNLRDRKPFTMLVGILLVFLVLITLPQVMLFLLCVLYVFSGFSEKPLVALYRRMQEQSEKTQPSVEPYLNEEVEDIEDKEILL
ncbi:CDP-diacylglycerol--serine O-phosphatidyltransferase [Nitrospira defluvii]|nr:CDP-diacylglycerol--serine O-phosphatidyltransferase [Nitrospira defluvii]